METKFQTSFIPKKPLVSDQRVVTVKAGTSILMVIAVLLFLASVGGAVFTVVWANVLNKNQDSYRQELAKMESRFPVADIEFFKKMNTKIDLSKQMLKTHIATAEIFSIISELTLENVRFNSFSFSTPVKESDGVQMTLSGTAKDFPTIAFQSDVFGTSEKYGKNKILKNPVISGVSEMENGNISFGFSATINPADLYYSKLLKQNSVDSNATTSSTTQ